MDTPSPSVRALETFLGAKLLDVLIRFGLILALALLCFRIFAPFLTVMVWALILAVTLYPAQRSLARRMWGKQWMAATTLALAGIVIIVAPTSLLMLSLGESVHDFAGKMQDHSLEIPAPPASVVEWPIIGKKVNEAWSRAHADLPAFVQGIQPQIAKLSRQALEMVAGIGGAVLGFLAAVIIAGIILAFGEPGARSSNAIFDRIVGPGKGEAFARLSTTTIRAVATGVLGVAFIQAILVGLVLMIAGVPFAAGLALIQLLLGILQIPALVVLPAIAYIWLGGSYDTGLAIVYTVLLAAAGAIDNVLKPILLARGVDAPMPVILLGALGGLVSAGILGMFVGATLLALGYQFFMAWVSPGPEATAVAGDPATDPAPP